MKPIFRVAVTQDVEQLVELRFRMQVEVNGSKGQEAEAKYREVVSHYFQRAIPDGSFVATVAEAAGKLVSVNGLVLYEKAPSIVSRSGLVGYVTNVYTLPEWRGRGIATELMKLLVEHAKAQEVDKLHLGATEAGKAVYEKVGFKPVRFVSMELLF